MFTGHFIIYDVYSQISAPVLYLSVLAVLALESKEGGMWKGDVPAILETSYTGGSNNGSGDEYLLLIRAESHPNRQAFIEAFPL